jgi:hypothetical protein
MDGLLSITLIQQAEQGLHGPGQRLRLGVSELAVPVRLGVHTERR